MIPKKIKEKTTRYYKEELKRLRKKIEELQNYIRGMKDIAFLSGRGSR